MFSKLMAHAGILLSIISFVSSAHSATNSPPAPAREFRAAWIATVANIDWPSRPGLPVATQKKEMIEILEKAKELNLNAIVFQARPACDTFYASEIEPWSDFLTGEQGKAPVPFYDPLEFIIQECHNRGMELHAWVNPYRAFHPSTKGALSEKHITKTNPEMAVPYGKHIWLDPGNKTVQDFCNSVVMDIVKRYDVDGIHLDDYFYPYREKDANGHMIEFGDETSWMEFVGEGGTISRDDWRRQNVNNFIERSYKSIKAAKPWVKFGVSPFGIWQPGNPRQIQGFNAYEQIYCDSKKWLTEGWLDYVAPQLYWKIEAPAQSYPVLLKWWVDQNTHGRHIWVGNFTSRVNAEWQPLEIVNQIKATREQVGATGNIHFSMKALQRHGNLSDLLMKEVYGHQALIPEMTWAKSTPLGKPTVKITKEGGKINVTWEAADNEKVAQWALQKRVKGEWVLQVLPGTANSITFAEANLAALPDFVAITGVNRYGLLSPSVAQNVQ